MRRNRLSLKYSRFNDLLRQIVYRVPPGFVFDGQIWRTINSITLENLEVNQKVRFRFGEVVS